MPPAISSCSITSDRRDTQRRVVVAKCRFSASPTGEECMTITMAPQAQRRGVVVRLRLRGKGVDRPSLDARCSAVWPSILVLLLAPDSKCLRSALRSPSRTARCSSGCPVWFLAWIVPAGLAPPRQVFRGSRPYPAAHSRPAPPGPSPLCHLSARL